MSTPLYRLPSEVDWAPGSLSCSELMQRLEALPDECDVEKGLWWPLANAFQQLDAHALLDAYSRRSWRRWGRQ